MKKMNEGMKALKKAAPDVAKDMGYKYGGMPKKPKMMGGGYMNKKPMAMNKGGYAKCGASYKG